MRLVALIFVGILSISHGMFMNRVTRSALNGTHRRFSVPRKPAMGYVAQWNRLSQLTDSLTTESRLRSSEQVSKWLSDCRLKVEDSPDLSGEAKVFLIDLLEGTEPDKLSIKLLIYGMNEYRTKASDERREILSRADSTFPDTIRSVVTFQLMMDFKCIQKFYNIKDHLKSAFFDTFMKASENQPILKSLDRYLFWKIADPQLIEFTEECEDMLMAFNTFLDVTQEIREFKYSNPDLDMEVLLLELSGQQLPFKGY